MDKSKFIIKPLEWKDEIEENGMLIKAVAYGLHAPWQIDYYPLHDYEESYYAQQNNLDDDCSYGCYFGTLHEAKEHCQAIHEKQVMAALEFVEVQE